MARSVSFLVVVLLSIGLSGCSYLFYPRAADYAAQAKGANGVETMINLTNMMEASATKAKGGKGVDPPFDDFHKSISCLVEFLLRRDEGTGKDTDIRLGCDPQAGTGGRIQETLEVQRRPTTARSTSGPIYRRTEGTARNLTDDQIKQIKAANGGLS